LSWSTFKNIQLNSYHGKAKLKYANSNIQIQICKTQSKIPQLNSYKFLFYLVFDLIFSIVVSIFILKSEYVFSRDKL